MISLHGGTRLRPKVIGFRKSEQIGRRGSVGLSVGGYRFRAGDRYLWSYGSGFSYSAPGSGHGTGSVNERELFNIANPPVRTGDAEMEADSRALLGFRLNSREFRRVSRIMIPGWLARRLAGWLAGRGPPENSAEFPSKFPSNALMFRRAGFNFVPRVPLAQDIQSLATEFY